MNYEPKWWLRNGHVQSIYPSLFRKIKDDFMERERIETPDHDFIDLDWGRVGSQRLVIQSHGLEGHSRRPYMLGMAQAANKHQWDVLAWNFRSCSGEPNRYLPSYHSGATHDLAFVVQYAAQKGYQEIALVGFSVGGNKTLRYLSLCKSEHPSSLLGAVAFSVPCDLQSCSVKLAKKSNRLYMINFLTSLREKLEQKKLQYPDQVNLDGFNKIKTFKQFDDRYTAPQHGFKDAEDYWRQSSSKPHLVDIDKPTLMISALDDPFLTQECFPYEIVKANPQLTLETPEYGGHVGFMGQSEMGLYWSELRAISFLNSISRHQVT